MRYVNDPERGIIPSTDGTGMTRAQALAEVRGQIIQAGGPAAAVDEYIACLRAADDDPVCVCGTHRSKHPHSGCDEWQQAR